MECLKGLFVIIGEARVIEEPLGVEFVRQGEVGLATVHGILVDGNNGLALVSFEAYKIRR